MRNAASNSNEHAVGGLGDCSKVYIYICVCVCVCQKSRFALAPFQIGLLIESLSALAVVVVVPLSVEHLLVSL